MSYEYTTRDGQRVEIHVAAAYDQMAADFKRDTGYSLFITSATRTDAQQEAIFRDRYVLAGQVNGRHVYDVRRWNGALWYRISSAGTVAAPLTSNHQESGPNGPRSIDIRDSGADWGVTRRGTVRDKWMEQHAAEYHFENEGYGFGEAWHKTFRGEIGNVPAPVAAPAHVPTPAPVSHPSYPIVSAANIGRIGNVLGLQKIARVGGYKGKLDNIWGKGSTAGFQHWLDRNYGGSVTRWLRAKYGYVGDERLGPIMTAALQRANIANWRANY